MKEIYLIISLVFLFLAIILLIHHKIKHATIKNKPSEWFQVKDIFNRNWSHEKFIVAFTLIAIGFLLAYLF